MSQKGVCGAIIFWLGSLSSPMVIGAFLLVVIGCPLVAPCRNIVLASRSLSDNSIFNIHSFNHILSSKAFFVLGKRPKTVESTG